MLPIAGHIQTRAQEEISVDYCRPIISIDGQMLKAMSQRLKFKRIARSANPGSLFEFQERVFDRIGIFDLIVFAVIPYSASRGLARSKCRSFVLCASIFTSSIGVSPSVRKSSDIAAEPADCVCTVPEVKGNVARSQAH